MLFRSNMLNSDSSATIKVTDSSKQYVQEKPKEGVCCDSEAISWVHDPSCNDYANLGFTRQESVLTQAGICSKQTKKHKIENHRKNKSSNKNKYDFSSLKKIIKGNNKKYKEDLYDLNNVIFLDSHINSACKFERQKEDEAPKIFIPEFRALDISYYKDTGESDNKCENDFESKYLEMHRPYELSESIYKFLDSGQGLPEELKNGLKIKIKLGKTPNELPSLM